MPVTPEDRERIESFRAYVEDSLASDDRYGPAVRHDEPERYRFASRWTVAPSCWFEMSINASPPEIRVTFMTSEAARNESIEASIQESGQKTDDYVGNAFEDAGLDWPSPVVEHLPQDNLFAYSTTLRLEELRDLDDDEIRDRVLRMLEGYMIAFAAALAVEEIGE
jgi:hypothetical protein